MRTVRRPDVERFLDGRCWHGQPVGNRTRYKWASTIGCFYSWAELEAGVTPNPTVGVIRPRLHRLLPRPWDSDGMEVALAAADRRMRCWILLAAYSGFRCCEISRLCRPDVLESWRPPMIVAHGKGGRDRAVPLHPRVAAALADLPMPRTGVVFRRRCGGPFSAETVSAEVAAHFRSLGMGWTAHQGRHWFGTHLLEAVGGDLRVVQETLGHESITSTTVYTAWSKAKAAEGVAALPVAQPRLVRPA